MQDDTTVGRYSLAIFEAVSTSCAIELVFFIVYFTHPSDDFKMSTVPTKALLIDYSRNIIIKQLYLLLYLYLRHELILIDIGICLVVLQVLLVQFMLPHPKLILGTFHRAFM